MSRRVVLWSLSFLIFVASGEEVCHAQGCDQQRSYFRLSQVEGGTFEIRVDWAQSNELVMTRPGTADRKTVGRGSEIDGPIEEAAGAAGVSVVYLERSSEREVWGSDTWRGSTREEAIRQFLKGVGLELVVIPGDVWIVIGDSANAGNERVEIQRVRLAGANECRGVDDRDVLRAFLPARAGEHTGVHLAAFAYSCLGTDRLLVAAETRGAFSEPRMTTGILTRQAGQWVCSWWRQANGWPLLSVVHDFDGDGVDDLVVEALREGPDQIISGSDGTTLLEFAGGEIAVPADRTPGLVALRGVGSAWKPETYSFDGSEGKFVRAGADRPKDGRERPTTMAAAVRAKTSANVPVIVWSLPGSRKTSDAADGVAITRLSSGVADGGRERVVSWARRPQPGPAK